MLFRSLAGLKVDQAQKVSGFHIILVKFKALPQTCDRTRQIPDAGPLQSIVIKTIGDIYNPLIKGYIGTAVRAKIMFGQCTAALVTIHLCQSPILPVSLNP